MDYFQILLLIHIAGAIIGFGPTFSFAILGPLSGKVDGPQALGIVKGMSAIERKLVLPVALVVQPLTGVLMIFESGRNQDFFSHEWLVVALVLYVIALYLVLFHDNPATHKMIQLMESGQAETPEFGALVKGSQIRGPILSLMLVTIIFLMITKPGGPDSFF